MTTPGIRLGGRRYSAETEPYVIAEIGVNHGGSLPLAFDLIGLAKEGGADAAKFQTYKAEKIASRHSPAYWDTSKEPTESQFQLFQKYHAFGADDYQKLAERCDEVGIDFLSTPFDLDALEFLTPLMSSVKIASADITNVPLLRRAGSKGRPIILSTGASTLPEIEHALGILDEAGDCEVSLLHCVLNYPTADDQAHLGMIQSLRRAFPDLVIGYSDHTVPDAHMTALTTAYLLGARIIEKHFTHDKTLPGNDHYHAMDQDDLSTFRERLRHVRILVGEQKRKRPVPGEDSSRVYARRSAVVVRDLPAGHVLTEADLIAKRPGTGISPVHWDELVGRRLTRAVEADQLLQWSDLRVVD